MCKCTCLWVCALEFPSRVLLLKPAPPTVSSVSFSQALTLFTDILFFFTFFNFVSLVFSHTIHPHRNLLSLHSSHQPPPPLPPPLDPLLTSFTSEKSRPPRDLLHSAVSNLTSPLLWPLFKWHQSFPEMISLRVLVLLFFSLYTTSRTI